MCGGQYSAALHSVKGLKKRGKRPKEAWLNRHCERSVAISRRLFDIAALRSRPEGWWSHPEEVPLGCTMTKAREFDSREKLMTGA
jgi:hypothetical protein